MASSASTSPTRPGATDSSPAAESSRTPPSSPPSEKPHDSAKMGDRNETGGTDAITATMQEEERRMAELTKRDDEERERRLQEERQQDLRGGQKALDSKYKALDYLLSQSKLYSTIMLSQMQRQEEEDEAKDVKDKRRAQKREEKAEKAAQASQRHSVRTSGNTADGDADLDKTEPGATLPTRGRGRPPKAKAGEGKAKITDYLSKKDLEGKAGKATIQEALKHEAESTEKEGVKSSDVGVQNLKSARQPDLVTGGMMRGYQLEGLEWLISLYENGLNGILADEMGLGKTIQTISFLAFLRDKGTYGPFLIAAPLSTTSNWIAEFKRWTPSIPAVLYHGSKQEREEIRRKKLRSPGSPEFPVICTSYEICMNDRKFLAHYGWKFIIIDEGHRIKNLNCRLIRELQSYQSANRLLITGTPLQNNLAELWSLLHFLMPEIFDKLESFESWFDFSALKERHGHEQLLSEDRKKSLVTSLHAILKPFLLRRVKADVEQSLPKKREYVLYAPLTEEQRELYEEILKGNSRSYLEDKVFETLSGAGSGANTPNSADSGLKRKALSASRSSTPNKSAKTSRHSTPATNGPSNKGRRSKKQQNYEELSDAKYFKKLEEGEDNVEGDQDFDDAIENDRAKTFALAKKQVAQKKLRNPVMQLRLCCNSPHNFYYPFLEAEDGPSQPHDFNVLVRASGKMMLLDRLLEGLLSAREKHKILLFSQFKTQLDLLADYLENIRKIEVCRIDGSVTAADRQAQIDLFNQSAKHRVFLLSTRAGGQGINLAAADTVVLFDSDWNPQQDLQAQDRAHRIGQTRNVIVYRLATRGTVEEVLLEKADGKRRLEKLVIQKGRFRSWTDRGARARQPTGKSKVQDEDEAEDDLDELRGLLGRSDGETYDLANTARGEEMLSKQDLAILTDRSNEAYERAEKGLDTGAMFKTVETKPHGDGLLGQLST